MVQNGKFSQPYSQYPVRARAKHLINTFLKNYEIFSIVYIRMLGL